MQTQKFLPYTLHADKKLSAYTLYGDKANHKTIVIVSPRKQLKLSVVLVDELVINLRPGAIKHSLLQCFITESKYFLNLFDQNRQNLRT